jgi:hypothetical protein
MALFRVFINFQLASMTIYEFQQLNISQQAEVIRRYGVLVTEKAVAGNRLYLYMINYFYVELLHELSNLDNQGMVISRIFDDLALLDDFIDHKPALPLHA